jgi:hypothetical protein
MVAVGNYRERAELRKKPRRQFHYGAKILTSEKGPWRPCALADVSETGARIVLERDEELPDRFLLSLSPRGDTRRVCRVVWRKGTTVGVKFAGTQS